MVGNLILLYLSCYKWNFTVIYFRYPSVMSKGNKDADNYDSWETTTIFVISSFQYITVAFCFSQGPPFRKACYIEYTSPWTGIKITTLGVIETDCTGSCKCNYHTITTTTAPGIKYNNLSIETESQ
jgi:magnesium-transporting ATPase (P-type)